MTDTELVDIHLLGLPLDLYARSAEHHDDLRREFALVAASDDTSIPSRLLRLSDELNTRFADFTMAPRSELAAAVDRGAPSIDLLYRVPAIAGEAADELARLFEEADDFCRREDLLTLEPSPDVLQFRRWFLGEFVRQAAGAPPTPWGGDAVTPPARG